MLVINKHGKMGNSVQWLLNPEENPEQMAVYKKLASTFDLVGIQAIRNDQQMNTTLTSLSLCNNRAALPDFLLRLLATTECCPNKCLDLSCSPLPQAR